MNTDYNFLEIRTHKLFFSSVPHKTKLPRTAKQHYLQPRMHL